MWIKKIPGVIVAMVLLFNVMALGAFAADDITYSDVSAGSANYDAIYYLTDEGVVIGYDDGTYKPLNEINRAEFLKIVMEVSEYEPAGSECYPDVSDEWFAPYVCKATDLGLVSGYPDGTFKPAQNINFVEASKIIVNTLDLPVDDSNNDNWYHKFVVALEDYYAIPTSIGSFDSLVTRGEMAEMIWRVDAGILTETSLTYAGLSGEAVDILETGDSLEEFESCAALESFMSQATDSYRVYDGEGMVGLDMAVEESSSQAKTAAPEAEAGPGGGSDDYSETNVQVEGVDEADVVKTDGEYIYYVRGDNIRVVKAYPPADIMEMDNVTFTNTSFYPHEIYVDGDRLVVLGTAYDYTNADDGGYGYYTDLTELYLFDISDKSNVELIRRVSFEGYYLSSRKIDDMVYLVANKYGYYWDEGDGIIPLYTDSKVGVAEPVCDCGDILYVPGSYNNDFIVVAGVPIDDADAEILNQTVIGSSSNIYASLNNLYIAESKYNWWWYDGNEETVVHKFDLDEDEIDYLGNGKVPGTILNQFSMDESDGFFRIATTNDRWETDGPKNNLYVLNEDMEVVGSVEGLAPGEEIYSVRFMGERAYMVTFEQIDPLFVIDLGDPANPEVLGELKIEGVSDYLHPYDANHIIGFGLDTLSASEIEELGWSWFQGVKISMFDVTDVENPIELHKEVIGDRGSTSELLYNHKALLFDKDKGIMAFPVTVAEIPQEVKDDLDIDDWVYGDYVFQGAYVYDVSVEDGFELRGTISHYDEDQLGDDFEYYYYYGDDNLIERILYIGEYFYTVSYEKVMANLMDSMEEEGNVDFTD